MKLFYLGVLKARENPPRDQFLAHELVAEKDLASFSRFTRTHYDQGLTFAAKSVAQGTEPGTRQQGSQDVAHSTYTMHSFARSEGVCGVAITDDSYPARAAQTLLSKIVDEFLTKNQASSFRRAAADGGFAFPELKEYLAKYQNPEEADPLIKMQKELDETMGIMRDNIIKTQERDLKLKKMDEDVQKLSFGAQQMFTQAKKQNSCCVVM